MVQSIRTLAARARADRRPDRADVPDPAHQRALLAARRDPGLRLARLRADPEIFQYYPGRGLQLQPLASWGRANAIAGACLAALRSRTSKDRCRPAALTRSLDRLDAPRRAPLRLPGVGVLLRVRLGVTAVGERDGAGDRRPGAVARLSRARRQALAAQRRAGAGRVRAAAADRRGGVRAGRQPLRPVLVRARPPRVQRRPAGRDRPARRGRADRLQARAAAVPARASARPGARCARSTPAPGRCTPSAARSRRSATTS